MDISVNCSGFKSYKLKFPINWKMDPYESSYWLHHFNSLRWLLRRSQLEEIRCVVNSFYEYHCINKKRNPYYASKRGDHTAAIRVDVLLKLQKRFSDSNDVKGEEVCKEIITNEIKNLQSEKIYRLGHNHGLMVDLALLNIIEVESVYVPLIDVDMILERSSKTIDMMWHRSGLTKEHSVSYQEYNLPLAIKYFDILSRLGVSSKSRVSLDVLLRESKEFLGYMLRGNGEYFPLGDSFRKPNIKKLKEAFKVNGESAHDLLWPYSYSKGCYVSNNFFVFRQRVKDKNLHFAATCCWDSHHHKQNDELSFCLEVNGTMIFDDPGYTEFLPKEGIEDLKHENSHTTITSVEDEWCTPLTTNNKSKINTAKILDDGFFVQMHAERIKGCSFTRTVTLNNEIMFIKDTIQGEEIANRYFKKKFILNDQVIVVKNGNQDEGFFLVEADSGKPLAEIIFLDSDFDKIPPSEISISEIKYVSCDRERVHSTHGLECEVAVKEKQTCHTTLTVVKLLG